MCAADNTVIWAWIALGSYVLLAGWMVWKLGGDGCPVKVTEI